MTNAVKKLLDAQAKNVAEMILEKNGEIFFGILFHSVDNRHLLTKTPALLTAKTLAMSAEHGLRVTHQDDIEAAPADIMGSRSKYFGVLDPASYTIRTDIVAMLEKRFPAVNIQLSSFMFVFTSDYGNLYVDVLLESMPKELKQLIGKIEVTEKKTYV